MSGLRLRLLMLLLAGLMCLAAGIAVAQPRTQQKINQEYDIKLAYLYKFGAHVTWPEIQTETFRIGILGKNPFPAAGLAILQKRELLGKPVVVQRFGTVAEYVPCQILFISRQAAAAESEQTPEQRLQAVLDKTRGTPVLVVGDSKGLAGKGASITFDVVANEVRMEANQQAAGRAQLKISSKLLSLRVVTVVEDDKPVPP